MRCLWKVGLPLQSKPGNQLSSRDDMGYTELSLSCCAEIGVPLNLCCNWCSSRLETGVSGNLWSCLKEVKPLVIYDVERGMALEPMNVKPASSTFDFGYTEIFRVPVVTSVFL